MMPSLVPSLAFTISGIHPWQGRTQEENGRARAHKEGRGRGESQIFQALGQGDARNAPNTKDTHRKGTSEEDSGLRQGPKTKHRSLWKRLGVHSVAVVLCRDVAALRAKVHHRLVHAPVAELHPGNERFRSAGNQVPSSILTACQKVSRAWWR